MSQMAPEAPPSPSSAGGGGGGGNIFKRKIGPLPMWVWLAIGIGAIGLYVLYKSKSSSSSSAAGATTSAATVPQFVNQTYTTVQPPVVNPAVSSTGGGGTSTPVVGEKVLTVKKNETLSKFAKEHHWTATTLAAVEQLNNLTGGSKLKKGQHIKRPWAPIQPGQTPDPNA